MEKKTRKNDVILIGGILLVALAVYVGFYIFQKKNTHEAVAVVTIDGEEWGRYPLVENRIENIQMPNGDYNILEISDGYADITEASCPDKICVHHRKIKKNGETIVCLPNQIVVAIQNGDQSDIDLLVK